MKKTISKILAAILIFSATAIPGIVSAEEVPVVIKNTWNAEPGGAIGVYGANFNDESAQVLLSPMSDYSEDSAYDLYNLRILNKDEGVITAELPQELPKDNYIGYVKTSAGISKAFYVNMPEIHWISEPEICRGQSVRIFGKNFLNPKTNDYSNAKAYVCSVDGEQTLEAEITGASQYTADIKIPNGVTEGKSYIVKYNNGACEYGLFGMDSNEAVPCVSDVQMKELKDKYGVEVAWASNLNIKDIFNVKDYGASGDGKADDSEAVQKALSSAEANGGGIIYLPAGEYNITSLTEALNIPDKVIIAGDGKDNTVINTDKRIYFYKNYGGITNISLKSDTKRPDNDTERYIGGYVGGILYANGNDMNFFAKNVDVNVADGSAFVSYSANNIVIEDCKFNVTHMGPYIGTSNSRKFKTRFINNYVRNTQRPLMMFGDYSWISNNKFVGENAGENCEKYNGEVLTMEHRITDMWGDNIYYGDNDISGIIGDKREDYDDSCGEGICNQIDGRIAMSSVVGADGNKLTTNLDFDKIMKGEDSIAEERGKRLIGAKLVILSGNGMGQIRKVTGVSEKTLELDSAWEIPPQNGDTFTVDYGICENNIIVNNNITAEVRKAAIMLYNRSANNIIAGNTITNSGGIWFGQCQDSSRLRTGISYFNYVIGNKLSGGVRDKANGARDNALSIGPGDDAGVKIALDASMPKLTAYYGDSYCNNTIKGNGTSLKSSSEYNAKFMDYNGIVVTTPENATGNYADGTIVAGNTVTNSINGVLVTSIAKNTLIYRNDFSANKNDCNDQNSKNTVIVQRNDIYSEEQKVSSADLNIIKADDLVKNPQSETDESNREDYENPYSDIENHWAKHDILLLTNLKVFEGYEDGTFRPDSNITRSEFVSVVMKCLGLQITGYKYQGLFNDVSKSSWYDTIMEKAFLLGLIDKNMISDWCVKPESDITREEMVSIVISGLEKKEFVIEKGEISGFKDSNLVTPWALDSMKKAYNAQIIAGNDNNELNPTMNATRAEAVIVLEKMLILLNN